MPGRGSSLSPREKTQSSRTSHRLLISGWKQKHTFHPPKALWIHSVWELLHLIFQLFITATSQCATHVSEWGSVQQFYSVLNLTLTEAPMFVRFGLVIFSQLRQPRDGDGDWRSELWLTECFFLSASLAVGTRFLPRLVWNFPLRFYRIETSGFQTLFEFNIISRNSACYIKNHHSYRKQQ